MSEEKQQIKPFFRVLNTDLIGGKPISMALLKVKGIGFSLSNAICIALNIPKTKKAGLLTEQDAKSIEEILKKPESLPHWMFNRRLDIETGETKHLTGSDWNFTVDLDIKKLKKIKAYRGIRHALGQPSRGQRTRSHFRHGRALGVMKQKVGAAPAKPAAAPAKSGKAAGGKK
ncbi:MAG TPA: 30S ribosomal protein S13 [Candidatus Nanoarchaeia archaeon]|nr:30S ribosomal protein S13 [Candidatus Nanoarchaeia archaeon]